METLSLAAAENRASRADLQTLADQCVMCGLCLPHCPTYRVERIESSSPRGRVALMKMLAAAREFNADEETKARLDACIVCGACERACPSKVRYVELLTRTRARLAESGERVSPIARASTWLLRRPRLMRVIRRFARAWPTRLTPRRWRALREIAASIPKSATNASLAARIDASQPTQSTRKALAFLGCAGASIERDTWSAAREVLATRGVALEFAPSHLCCGALDWHAGNAAAAQRDAERTRASLRARDADWLVHSSSGCHRAIAGLDLARTGPTRELSSLLAEVLRDAPPSARTPLHVALHLPCTHRDLDAQAPLESLLRAMPGVRVTRLPSQPTCCGAGGRYFIDHGDIASSLRDELVTAISALKPDRVLTTNPGCRLQLQAGVAAAGLDVPVIHPVSFLLEVIRS